MIYEVEYDLQWGMRGNRSVIYYMTDKKPTIPAVVKVLKEYGIESPNRRAITIKKIPLMKIQSRENGRPF